MGYILTFHGGYLVAALLLGLAMGWIAVVRRGKTVPGRAMPWIGASLAILLVMSTAHFIPGRFGYWLDLGLVMFAIYLLGCAVGSWLRERVVLRQMTPAA